VGKEIRKSFKPFKRFLYLYKQYPTVETAGYIKKILSKAICVVSPKKGRLHDTRKFKNVMKILKNIVLFITIFVLFLFILINLRLSNITVNSFTQFTKEYTGNFMISIIFRLAIFLDILMILSILSYYIFDWKNNIRLKEIIRKILLIIISVLLFLIWFEIYFGTTFQHGYERTLLAINNSGLIGSLLFSLLTLVLLKYENIKLKNKILITSLFIIIIFFHFIVYVVYN
jgi:hypothetical protein